jgi:hypothetical protein
VVYTFRENNGFNAFLLFAYGFLLKLPYFLHPAIPDATPADGFLYYKVLEFVGPLGRSAPVLYPFIAYILLYTQALTFNQLIGEQRLMYKPHYLVAMAYLLITSLVPEWNNLSSVLITNSVMVWAWPRMVSLYNHAYPKATIFNIGLALGICSFFYLPSILFLLLLGIALLIFRPFSITEWLVALVGITCPYYFLFLYLYLSDKFSLSVLLPDMAIKYPRFHFDFVFSTRIVLLTLPLLIGWYYIQRNRGRMLIQVRKSVALLLCYLCFALLLPLVNGFAGLEYWVLAAIPLSVYHAAGYLYARRIYWVQLLHWLTVLFIILCFVFGHK